MKGLVAVFMLIVAVLSTFYMLTLYSHLISHQKYRKYRRNRTNETLILDDGRDDNFTTVLSTPIELTIRMPLQKEMIDRLFCSLLRSAALFWPHNYGKVVIILDEEDYEQNFHEKFSSYNFPFHFRFVYEFEPYDVGLMKRSSRKTHRSYGYTRMLYSSFLMDLYTDSSSIIAWTDTDVIFTMPVVNQSIFRNGRLIAKGTNTFKYGWVHGAWNTTTILALGLPMVSDFMSYFPAYLYPSTIKNCREYIIRRLGASNMEDAFSKFVMDYVSPVNIILNYAYYFERDLYEWNIDIGENTLEDYNRKYLNRNYPLLSAHISPELHVTIHTRYYESKIDPLEQAICYAQIHLGRRNIDHCKEFLDKPNMQLFEFQSIATHIDTWCGGDRVSTCIDIIEKRYDSFVKLYREKGIVIDINCMKIVEDFAANEYNLKCSAVRSVSFI